MDIEDEGIEILIDGELGVGYKWVVESCGIDDG